MSQTRGFCPTLVFRPTLMSATTVSQLEFIRRHTSVSCDSFDINVVKEFGPFVNCTSNQAIIYGELIKESNKIIVAEAARLADKYDPDDNKCVKYGVKAAMVILALRILPHLTGSVLLQSSMHAAHSRDETVDDVLEIIRLFKQLSPGTPLERICIKIPATYEGLEACRILNEMGIGTLATCVFSVEQGILASEVGCRFVSPYINELKVHFTPGMIDEHKLFPTIRQIYEYYESREIKTKIILGSFVSYQEVLEVSGIHGVTLPHKILKDMSTTTISAETALSYPTRSGILEIEKTQESQFLNNEKAFKAALSSNKEATRKLQEAISFFLDTEKQLEDIVRNALQEFPLFAKK